MRPDILDQLVLAGLDPAPIGQLAAAALAEDLAAGVDVTSVACVPFDLEGVARMRTRQDGVLAGLAIALAVIDVATEGHFDVVDAVADATVISAGEAVLTIEGFVRPLLTAERTALNLVCHLSGIATATRAWVLALEGTGARVRDTRKTTPGLRILEKYAVRCGGGINHRMALSDAALVKDNHVAAAGGVAAAFTLVRETFPGLPVEVECDTVAQVVEAVAAGADLVLLDNMSVEQLKESVALTRPAGVLTEASGGLTLATAGEVGRTGVDFLAVGALTHSAPVLDLGFDLSPILSRGGRA